MLDPRLDILPKPQRRLWPELAATPQRFVLYGGTAIALRLGHRTSVDFDFFAFEQFAPLTVLSEIAYLQEGTVLQSAPSTLTCRLDRDGPVQVSYFGLTLGQVAQPEPVSGPGFLVAMPIDLGGTKMAVVTQRVEPRDYIDVHALLRAGLSLAEMLAGARAIYGEAFSPLVALKALAYFDDPALASLSNGLRSDLAMAVRAVDVAALPALEVFRARRGFR